jgi:hypothetical protein
MRTGIEMWKDPVQRTLTEYTKYVVAVNMFA